MARTDRLVIELVELLALGFTNTDKPPVGGTTGPPQVRAGDGIPALDGFDDCTLLWLNITNRYRTDNFPDQQIRNTSCGTAVAVHVQVGVARCSQALTHTGGLPSAETMAAEFAAQEDDADRLDTTLCVAGARLEKAGHILGWVPVSTDVIGPEGGTVAVVAQAAFHLP